MFRDRRQPRFVDRRSLRVCRSGVWALRGIPRRDALFSHGTRRGCWRRERIGKLRRSGGAVPRRSRDADYRDVRGLWLPSY